MKSVRQNFKVWILIGILYTAYCAIMSSRLLKRITTYRINWGAKS